MKHSLIIMSRALFAWSSAWGRFSKHDPSSLFPFVLIYTTVYLWRICVCVCVCSECVCVKCALCGCACGGFFSLESTFSWWDPFQCLMSKIIFSPTHAHKHTHTHIYADSDGAHICWEDGCEDWLCVGVWVFFSVWVQKVPTFLKVFFFDLPKSEKKPSFSVCVWVCLKGSERGHDGSAELVQAALRHVVIFLTLKCSFSICCFRAVHRVDVRCCS